MFELKWCVRIATKPQLEKTELQTLEPAFPSLNSPLPITVEPGRSSWVNLEQLFWQLLTVGRWHWEHTGQEIHSLPLHAMGVVP